MTEVEAQPIGRSEPDVLTFWEFFQAFVHLNKISLVLRGSHREICELYQSALLGQMPGYEYFIVNMPRRIGKTKILEALACWMFGEFGDAQMIYSSYSDKLVSRSIAYSSRTLRQPWFIDLYGDKVHSMRADLVTTTEGGTLYGAGTGATITGFGAGLKEPAGGFIAIDDPAKPDESLSVVESQNVQQNFETTFKGCRNSDRYAPIIINAQRLGPEDLPGYVLKTYPNQTYHLKIPCFIVGRSQFPETWSDTTHDQLQATRLGRFVLASQFQQEPVSLGGNLIPVDKFVRYDHSTIHLIKWERLIIPIDTALKIKQSNDFSCAQLWGLFQKRAYLIDLIHGKWESPELLANVVAFWEKYQCVPTWPRPKIIIEEKAAGTPLLQNLNRQRVPAVGIERDIDKVRRLQSVLPYIETGCVCIPQDNTPTAPWLAGFVTECAAFSADGKHAHDDRVDPLIDSVEGLLGRPLSSFDVLMTPKR